MSDWLDHLLDRLCEEFGTELCRLTGERRMIVQAIQKEYAARVAAGETHSELLAEIYKQLERVGIEFEDGCWTCSAEPEPVVLDTLEDAIRCFTRLKPEREPLEMYEHHWCEGHGFKRLDDGSVRHRWPGGEIVIPPAQWASIVAHVSAKGENGETFDEAQALHGGFRP